ncbi:hypothetical protein RIF23_09785 [Lipingzhangella sp. LS1_29]|uniref:Phosphotriesterase-related protein n=1 Tax=Lipingzhangella rawalii TaxID=2055835 RepID=A0ABU2H6F5_9ACTN|nr:hypothetical protein [Lipingzhangella rawalii]MDS1270587.1 hypothetical protein [Lipingzhangella rawalii]
MDPIVRTVTGDLPPGQLRRTDMHEALLRRSPLRPEDALDDVDLSGTEARDLAGAGIDSIVELTPPGLGRAPSGLAAIAQYSGLAVIAASGTHRAEHYPEEHWIRALDEDKLADLIARDITHGCIGEDGEPAQPPGVEDGPELRAGVIRVGLGYWRIGALERRFLAAAALAQRLTGAAIICTLSQATSAVEALETMTAHGVRPDRIALSRIDHCPDAVLHAELAAAGAYVCYTGAGHHVWPDAHILDCLLSLVERGHASRILVGGARGGAARYTAYGGMPGLSYLPRRFLPRLRSVAGSAVTDTILERNPARLLTLAEPG